MNLNEYLKINKFKLYKTKSSGVAYIDGKHYSSLKEIEEIQDGRLKVWESEWNNTWKTFIKNPLIKEKSNPKKTLHCGWCGEEYESLKEGYCPPCKEERKQAYEAEMNDSFIDRDDLRGDPDLLEWWDEKYK